MGPRVSGPRLEYWGVLGPIGRRKGLRAFSILYVAFSPISSMWDYVPFNFSFAGHVAEQCALDLKLTEDCTLI